MKRDARIGLAVVLLLGLSVTLLVARSIHSHSLQAEAAGAAVASVESPAGQDEAEAQPQAGEEQQNSLVQFRARHAPVAQLEPRQTPGAEVVEGLVREPAPAPQNVQPSVQPNAAPATTYTVMAGDTPQKISQKVYGHSRFAQKILTANPGVSATRLAVGQKLTIPAVGAPTVPTEGPVERARSAPVFVPSAETNAWLDQPSTPPQTEVRNAPAGAAVREGKHKVQAGETLAKIAKNVYGSSGPKTIQRIVAANPGLKPDKLQVGQLLTLPPGE